jgi:hypothetical protein
MPMLRAAIAPKPRPTAVATRSAATTASQGDHAAAAPPSAMTRLANVMPATP